MILQEFKKFSVELAEELKRSPCVCADGGHLEVALKDEETYQAMAERGQHPLKVQLYYSHDLCHMTEHDVVRLGALLNKYSEVHKVMSATDRVFMINSYLQTILQLEARFVCVGHTELYRKSIARLFDLKNEISLADIRTIIDESNLIGCKKRVQLRRICIIAREIFQYRNARRYSEVLIPLLNNLSIRVLV